jgi:predicted nucleic acid-binding protein
MPCRFLDTNILLRYFTQDDPEKARSAFALLMRVERGEERVETSLLVMFETVFTLQHRYRLPRDEIRDALCDLLSLRNLKLAGKSLLVEALALYAGSALSFTDAYNAVYMKRRRLAEVYSWDADLDRVPGIRRVEP